MDRNSHGTGGDRYRDGDGNIRSSSNGEIVKDSVKDSSHLVENGARGVDVYVSGKTDQDVKNAAGASGFDPNRTIGSGKYPKHPHEHLEVPKDPHRPPKKKPEA